MKKRVFRVVILALSLCLFLCSCQAPVFIRTVDSLLTPPLYYSEYEGLLEAFHTEVGSSVILCNPIEGDHLSAITVADVDGNGTEEGIIFYRDALESEIAKFAVFTCMDDNWERCGIYSGYGDEIRSLVLTDFDGDTVQDILITWNYSGINGGSVFSAYRSEADELYYTELTFQSCNLVKAIDMDGDNINEIFFVSTLIDNNASTRSAELYKYKDGKFYEAGSAMVDPFVGSYTSFVCEGLLGFPLTVYFDGVKSNNIVITESVTWDPDEKNLKSVFYDEESGTNIKTIRYEQIPCADINDDSLVEIPVQTAHEETEEQDGETTAAQTLYETEWVRFEGENETVVERSFVNDSDGYIVNLDLIPSDEAFVRKQEGGDWTSWSVYIPDEENYAGNTLFTIVNVPKSRWESEINNDSSDYITIFKKDSSVICVKINAYGKESGLDESAIKKIVTVIPQ